MIFYQGLASLKLNKIVEGNEKFNKLINYGEKHLLDNITIDYFAVSLPDFLIFDEDLNKKNMIHCHYLMGLGYIGLNKVDLAKSEFNQILELEANHQGAIIHQKMITG